MNIEEYEFKDTDISLSSKKFIDDGITIKVQVIGNAYTYMFLSKHDVIALAKHFELTADDIKDK